MLARHHKQRQGPLKKVVKVLRKQAHQFDQGVVRLECGHEVRSNSTGRARCDRCPKV